MNGIHDLGGMDGFGRVLPEQDEPLFHTEWERTVFGMFLQVAVGGYFQGDAFRGTIERMDPVEYLTYPYYAHWMHGFEHYILPKEGIAEEMDRRTALYRESPGTPLPASVNDGLEAIVSHIAATGINSRRPSEQPMAFKVGDTVTVLGTQPYGHTRRPRYVRGKTGVVHATPGSFNFPDSPAGGGPEIAEYVYSVRFTAEELYGEGIGHPRDTGSIDLFEPYLVAAIAAA